MYIILNHYSNESIGEFDSVQVMSTCYDEQAAAIAAADAMLAEDIDNGIERETVPVESSDIGGIDEMYNAPVYIAGVMEQDNYDCFHNVYLVFEVTPVEKGDKK